jgi:phosphoglycolate phosphatase-like HAD superfamily hydrolase
VKRIERGELDEVRVAAHVAVEQLAAMVLAGGVSSSPSEDDLKHAALYAAEAAKLRRRAAHPRPGEAMPVELERRALFFEGRADVKRSGRPMPRHLRTEAETLAHVDAFRRRLVELLEDARDRFHPDDFAHFAECLRSAAESVPPSTAAVGVRDALASILAALSPLGVTVNAQGAFVFVPFRSPLDLVTLVTEPGG